MIPEQYRFSVSASTREELLGAAEREATSYFGEISWEITAINVRPDTVERRVDGTQLVLTYEADISARRTSDYRSYQES